MDCLVLVERGVTEYNNIVDVTVDRGLQSFFKELRSEVDDASLRTLFDGHLGKEEYSVADYGISQELSLTSVLMASLLEKEQVSFAVLDDDEILDKYGDYLIEKLNEVSLVLVSSTYAVSINTIADILDFIRKHCENPDLKIMVGGKSITMWQLNHRIGDMMFKRLSGADYFYFGDGDTVLGPLVRKILDGDDVQGIPGLTYRDGEGYAGSTEHIQAMAEDIASPDWSVVFRHDFNAKRYEELPDAIGMEEGRGCAFNCRFCTYASIAKFTRRPPIDLVDEMERAVELGVKRISFFGSELLTPLSFSEPLLNELIKRDLPLEIWTFARLDTVSKNPHLAELMHKAKITTIQFGLESGSKKLLKAMNKKFDPHNQAAGVQLLHDNGIEVKASVIIGYPGETEETLMETKEVLKDCAFDEVMIHGLAVLPGTPLYDSREDYGIQMTPSGWMHETMRSTDLPYYTEDMVVYLTENTETFIVNIGQNFATKFFSEAVTGEKLRTATLALQRLLAGHWKKEHGKAEKVDRLALISELLPLIDTIPHKYFA